MIDTRMKLNDTERSMFAGALNIAVQLAMSENSQHKDMGKIIAGLCAIINKVAQIDDPTEPIRDSWFCDPCKTEVYGRRCLICGKTEKERA